MSEASDDVSETMTAQAEHLAFDKQVAHMASGYSNSQSTVRFLDAKAGAVIGAVPILLGILAAAFNWLYESDRWAWVSGLKVWQAYALWGLGILLLAVLLCFACLSVWAAFNAISPQDPGNSKASLLFPYESEDFKSRVKLFADAPSESIVIEDYQRQLLQMSRIVRDKMTCAKRAIHWLKKLFIVAGLILFVMGVVAFSDAWPGCN